MTQDVLQFRAGLENFFGVGQRQSPCRREFHPAPATVEQGNAKPFLELQDLAREGLRCQMQALGCTDDATFARNADEVMQMFVIQHGAVPLSVFFEYIANYYLFVSNDVDPHNSSHCC